MNRPSDGRRFAAQVGNTTLPAGEYSVRTLENGGSSTVIGFDSSTGHHVAAHAKRVPQTGPSSAELKFTRSAEGLNSGGLKLSQIFVADQSYSYELAP